jgi:hypothetical protein
MVSSGSSEDEQAELVQSAVLSINHHAIQEEPAPEGTPEEYLPRPLSESVTILIEKGGFPQQKGALAILIAGGVHLRSAEDNEAVRLLANQVTAHDSRISERVLAIDPAVDGPRAAQEAFYAILAETIVGGGANCSGGDPIWWAWRDPNTNVTTADCKILVAENPLDSNRVARLLDPVRWHPNYPNYFVHSYPTAGQYNVNDGIAVQYNGPKVPQDSVTAWGHSSTDLFIYEELHFPTKLAKPYHELNLYRNLLIVEWSGLPGGQLPCEMEYRLGDSTWCELFFGALMKGPDGINVDKGNMLAAPQGNGWVWTGLKSIRFLDLTPGQPQGGGVPDFGQIMNWILPGVLGDFLKTGMESSCCAP